MIIKLQSSFFSLDFTCQLTCRWSRSVAFNSLTCEYKEDQRFQIGIMSTSLAWSVYCILNKYIYFWNYVLP